MDTQNSIVERPRRLLHVPTMTSVTWDSIIGTSKHEPIYNALSYTWGRFISNDRPIHVDGISWGVPGVQSSHFTTTEFYYILQTIAPESGYVWVDIACIDQDYLPMKMKEIGKQADIFRGASDAFIWLTNHTVQSLKDNFDILSQFVDRLDEIVVERSHFLFDKNEIQTVCNEFLPDTIKAASRLLRDPWFTSLWALQEAHLRSDATILSKSGCQMLFPSQKPLKLDHLCASMEEISNFLRNQDYISEKAQTLLENLERSGLLGMNTGMPVQIYPAAHARRCENEIDRVYAIMQVYRLRLGSSRNPQKSYTLEELEEELVKSLNGLSPICAQFFIHRTPPKPGKAWMITGNCILFNTYYLIHSVEECCTVVSDLELATSTFFKGKSCNFEDLIGFWAASTDQRKDQYQSLADASVQFFHYQVDVDLDAGHVGDEPRPGFFRLVKEYLRTCSCPFCRKKAILSEPTGLEKLLAILPLPISEYSVLKVARLFVPRMIGSAGSYTVSSYFGIIGTTEQHGDKRNFSRVGVCVWEKFQGGLLEIEDTLWTTSVYNLI